MTTEQTSFSVVIPTKNRSHLVINAINSVISQSYENWELIVIDNDDSDDTKAVCDTIKDQRFSRIKTGSYPMCDNWEAAILSANNEYIIILEDKLLLQKDSLQLLNKLIKNNKKDIYTWPVGAENIDDELSNDWESINSKEILEDFILNVNKSPFWEKAPRGLNTCFSKSLRDRILSESDAICLEFSPDFTMAYQMLLCTDDYIHLHAPLMFCPVVNSTNSNGLMARLGKIDQVKAYLGIDDETLLTKHMPLKIIQPLNGVINDFWLINETKDIPYSISQMNLSNYYIAVWRDVMVSTYKHGANLPNDIEHWMEQLKKSSLSREEKQNVLDRARQIERRMKPKEKRLTRFINRLKRRFSKDF